MKPKLYLPFALRVLITFAPLLLYSTKVLAQPANNNCSGAVLLTSSTSCSNTAGTVANATNSGIAVGTCTGTADDDVWYQFVSASTDHTITLSNLGTNLNNSGARLQLFSGTCGALVSVACGTTSIAATNLARNTTYYIRVYSAGATTLTTNAGFNICVTHPAIPTPSIDFGKSYVNTSKPTGGTVETNDILEIRASVVVRSGSFDSCGFTDVIPTGTTYIPGTLRVLTNEGKIFRQFTDAQFDASNDEGWISGTTVKINLGFKQTDQPATISKRGRIRNNNGHKPTFYGGTCIMIASYRVIVTAATGALINTGGGSVTYTTAPPTVSSFTFPSRIVSIYSNYGICPNSVGVNSLGTETNGTFGTGNLRNRGASTNVPAGYTYSMFTSNMPNDYYYGVANNTSTVDGYSTVNTWAKPDGSPTSHRVFSVWDIIGDHTGATNPITGNSATDTTGGKKGGYMLVINAAYRIDSAFQHTITGLCPNTYYEISCWMRNICSKCGCDSNGVGATSGAGYIPTATGDSAGVYPNLAFALDGVDYYTSGDIKYTGQWIKKGFTFLTGNLQNSFTIRFYNNAPGGGGNDWALDDISVATCSPNMKYSPSLNPIICAGNAMTISDTIQSYFNNYTYYNWQRSTDGGATWTNVTSPSGPATPVWNGTAWQYVISYTIPPVNTTVANNNDMYRVVVATTSTNLSNTACRFTDGGNIIKTTVIDCGPPLSVELLNFSGKLDDGNAVLNWTTATELEPFLFEIEQSADGINFQKIAVKSSHRDYTNDLNLYDFTDHNFEGTTQYYRVKIRSNDGRYAFTRIIKLSMIVSTTNFGHVINPFNDALTFEINVERQLQAQVELIDANGNVVRKMQAVLVAGSNRLCFRNTTLLPGGIYTIRIMGTNLLLQKNVFKGF